MACYFYDESRTRYHLQKTCFGTPYNWLFLPGGPGGDSSYLQSLTNILDLPGNTWLVDLPGNGSNLVVDDYNFEKWFDILIPSVSKFENPILVGHSFGGMFPLLFPKLEKYLKGLVILNSAPSAPLEEAVKCGKLRNLPDLAKEMEVFSNNPNEETFRIALNACIPYYFSPDYLEQGKKFLENVKMQFRPSAWWSQGIGKNFNATWVPQKVPTLIIGGDNDSIAPISIFENDKRFKRDNIFLKKIEQSGHFSWIDQPDVFKNIWMEFITDALSKNSSFYHSLMLNV